MIKTVTVYTGESEYIKAAQEHAIEIAKKFDARLQVIGIWNIDKQSSGAEGYGLADELEELVKRNQEDIVRSAERAGVCAEKSLRGEGLTRGLLEQARETDLLVLGLPTEMETERDDAASCLIKTERPVLRKAECSLLVVNRPPSGISKVLTRYEEGSIGKTVLRMAGFIAERYGSRLGVLTIEEDIVKATELAAAAEAYLKGFDITAVDTLPHAGSTDSKAQILHTAESFGADLIAMGDDGHNWLERAIGRNIAERTVLATSTPLFIAR